MREIVHLQAGQCGNQIGAKVSGPGSREQYNARPVLAPWILDTEHPYQPSCQLVPSSLDWLKH
jgi:hypothetical protein